MEKTLKNGITVTIVQFPEFGIRYIDGYKIKRFYILDKNGNYSASIDPFYISAVMDDMLKSKNEKLIREALKQYKINIEYAFSNLKNLGL